MEEANEQMLKMMRTRRDARSPAERAKFEADQQRYVAATGLRVRARVLVVELARSRTEVSRAAEQKPVADQ
jgi:hypothetical protein